jgi:outer membrane protein TolC
MTSLRSLLIAGACVLAATTSAKAQVSLTTAVDLALKNSPRVLGAQAEVNRAKATLELTHDVYIPSLSLGSGLGYTYGFPFGAPSLFSVTAQSLLFDQSQKNYVRAARAGLESANHNLNGIRQEVVADVVTTYITLDADLERMKAAQEESQFAKNLIEIVQQRLDAGQDTQVELTRSRLTAANLDLRRIQLEDDADNQRDHMARVTGLPSDGLATIHSSIPALPKTFSSPNDSTLPESIQAAYSIAQSKQQTAFGDLHKLYKPQLGIGLQYSRLASFNNYQRYYQPGSFDNYNNLQVGLQFNFPIFDRSKRAKAQESMAEASHSLHDADQARNQFFEGRHRMRNAVRELAAHTEVTSLQRELALNQLDVIQLQLQSSTGGTPITPKDGQNARIQERARYLEYLDADLQLRQTQVDLLRSNGDLEGWLRSAAQSQSTDLTQTHNSPLPQSPSNP